MNNTHELKQRLIDYKQKNGLSTEKLAQHMGITTVSMYRYLRGAVISPMAAQIIERHLNKIHHKKFTNYRPH